MKITTVITISRPECIDIVKDNLARVSEIEKVVIMVDNPKIGRVDWGIEAEVVRTRNPEPTKMNVNRRRDRITDVRNLSRKYVSGSDFVFSFEDDTVLPDNALTKLHQGFGIGDRVGMISGIQVGRWNKLYPGAWHADDLQFPTEVKSIDRKKCVTPIMSVDATGFYCFMTPTRLYEQANFGWHDPMGPDFWYGARIAMMGYTNYVDLSVECGHWSPKGVLYPSENDVPVVISETSPGKWLVRNQR